MRGPKRRRHPAVGGQLPRLPMISKYWVFFTSSAFGSLKVLAKLTPSNGLAGRR